MTSTTGKRVAAAMSGGVDSSTAAALLRDEGCEVLGLTMRLQPAAAGSGASASTGSADEPRTAAGREAAAVCAQLGIPHREIDLSAEFERHVVGPFVAEYAAARTPNPCARCNRHVKFGALWRIAREAGCEALATGHYARLTPAPDGSGLRLRRGKARRYDQSYFLFALPRERLPFLRFPLGEMSKDEVRELAAKKGLRTAERPASQEICFIPDENHRRFLRERAPEAFCPGPIFLAVDGEEREVGRHDGLCGFTIGQRKGLRVAWRRPLYVARLDRERNAVILAPDEALWITKLRASECNWSACEPPAAGGEPLRFRAEARVRHGGAFLPCTVEVRGEGAATVRFDEPVRAAAPGQAVVFYRGDEVLGGGWIETMS